eukprot:Sspe_Gene.89609::Locus_61347_Transcript_1_1_Confidence_1.000_Length_1295::g.89609::m.89609/K16862/PLD6; mitochondrial cardiolipin hydrolase
MVVDGRVLLTGSNNWSSTGTSINEENTVVVEKGGPAGELVEAFECHFTSIWEAKLEMAWECSRDGTVAFSPSSLGYKLARDAIRGATGSIDVLMHHLTFSSLVKELARAQERGVQVRVVLNGADVAEHTGSYWDRLVKAGGQIRYKLGNPDLYQLMHHKLAIVDGKVLINGSGNWSGSGFFNNFENYVRYTEQAVVTAFTNTFNRIWSWSVVASDVPPPPPPPP